MLINAQTLAEAILD